jgi:predicted alpha/beta-hydrolase family hydrolase
MIPGLGPILIAGPMVAWVIGALESAVVVGGISALGVGLYSIGIPKNSVVRYETAIKAGKYVLIAHGTADEVANAKENISKTKAIESVVHDIIGSS